MGGGGVHEKPICWGDCLKRRGLAQFADLGGRLGKKRGGGVFEGVIDTLMQIMLLKYTSDGSFVKKQAIGHQCRRETKTNFLTHHVKFCTCNENMPK